LLNGISFRNATATQMQVNQKGNLFFGSGGAWNVAIEYLVSNATSPTTGPIPIACTCSPSLVQSVTTATPVSTPVSAITVRMSDGTVYSGGSVFPGTYVIQPGFGTGTPSILTTSGNEIITRRPLTSADINNQGTYQVTATLNGVTAGRMGPNMQVGS
jgi:hypothetical protein